MAGAGQADPLAAAQQLSAPPDTRAPLRIRTGHSYHVPFTITLGQSNARFVQRALTPLNRYLTFADSFAFTPEPGFDAIHSWNAVPLMTRRPFIVTFEDFLPRTPQDRRIGWLERTLRDRLVDDRCVAIVACSEYAVRQLRHQHRDYDLLPEILARTEVIYPTARIRRDRPKRAGDRLRLLFVGRDFMRKGGPALIRAHARLRRAGIPVETTIVSGLQWSANDYVGPPDAAYVDAAHAAIAQEGVVHHLNLANPAVNDLMEEADFLVFPTFHDTFGFVALEALAAATPVIASDTCVMPEVIESGASGYLLPFESDLEIGRWTWLYRQREAGYLDAYENATAQMADALFERLAAAWEGRQDYERLSAGALARARTRFNPETARLRLESLYERFHRA